MRRRFLISFLFLCFATASAFAQEPQGGVLIDRFERTPCDDFRARLEYVHNHLSVDPTSIGYVVIFGELDNMRANVFYEGMIKGYFAQREFASERLQFFHSSFKQKLEFEFWRVPMGAEPPALPSVSWSYKMGDTVKPYKFTWENVYDDICPNVDGVELYAQFLKANPTAHGNIVIRDYNSKRVNRKTKSVLSELVIKHGIPRKQLNLFRVLARPDGLNEPVEYWLVQNRRK